jgi:histone-lysine N-methyltransferase SETD1
VPFSEKSEPYRFCFVQIKEDDIINIQRKRAVITAEKSLQNLTGCARAEGMSAFHKSVGSGRITRALVRRADDETMFLSQSNGSNSNLSAPSDDYNKKYQEMKSVPFDQKLIAKRSHIHGWGLFAKVNFTKDSMIIEYMGEVVRQCTADKREREYEESGIGSCYMFRLDWERIVDATTVGSMARFMNHSCSPNCYAKVINVTDETGASDNKIIVFANKDIISGEEITYDYKFPVEDGSLRCSCGAPNCIGRMN